MTKINKISSALLAAILMGVVFTSLNIQQAFAPPPVIPACGAALGPGVVNLGGSIGPCPGVGVTLASGTRLNMNGFTISGAPGSATGIVLSSPGGSEVNGPGTVTGFSTGISMGTCALFSSSNKIHGVSLIGDTSSPRSDDPLPAGVAVFGNGVAISGSGNMVSGSTITHYPEYGVTIFCGSGNKIGSGNTITFNNGFPVCGGIRLLSAGNTVQSDNNISFNGDQGIIVFVGPNTIKSNTLVNNAFSSPAGFGIGIEVAGAPGDNDIRDNAVSLSTTDVVDLNGVDDCWKNNTFATSFGNISPQNGTPSTTCPGF